MTSHSRWIAAALAVVVCALAIVLLQPTILPAGEVRAAPAEEQQPDDQPELAPEPETPDFVADTVPASVITTTTTFPTVTSTSPLGAAPPFPEVYEPAPNEVQADAKRTGGAVVQHLTNYGPDASPAELAARVTPDVDRSSALIAAVDVVHHPRMWSRGTIEYAQLGGHHGSAISIMVVVRQDVGREDSEDPVRTETRTMDVRLVMDAFGEWEFDRLASTGGEPMPRPDDLSPLAAWVVDSKRIDLPDSAKWDIYSGHTDPALLRLMADLAGETRYSVAVLHTGHPHNVFGTDRVSNHTVGRAVDIYAMDSLLLIDAHNTSSTIYQLAEQLVWRTDIREFGSPWLFDGAPVSNFTNEVHHDHLHIGVYPADHAAG